MTERTELLHVLSGIAAELRDGPQRPLSEVSKDLEALRDLIDRAWNDPSRAAAVLGRKTSERKAAASRENGRKGGKPARQGR